PSPPLLPGPQRIRTGAPAAIRQAVSATAAPARSINSASEVPWIAQAASASRIASLVRIGASAGTDMALPITIARTRLLRAARIRREAIAVVSDRDLDHIIADDADLRRFGAVGRHDAASVGGDLQPAVTDIGAPDDEDRPVRAAHFID